METLRKTIFTGWNFMRWLRLALGLIIAYQAIELHNGVMGLLAGLFMFQALTNTGCCGTAVCNTRPARHKPGNIDNLEFEEVKDK